MENLDDINIDEESENNIMDVIYNIDEDEEDNGIRTTTATLKFIPTNYGGPITVKTMSILPIGLLEEALSNDFDVKQLKGTWTVFVYSDNEDIVKQARYLAKELYYSRYGIMNQEVNDVLDNEDDDLQWNISFTEASKTEEGKVES